MPYVHARATTCASVTSGRGRYLLERTLVEADKVLLAVTPTCRVARVPAAPRGRLCRVEALIACLTKTNWSSSQTSAWVVHNYSLVPRPLQEPCRPEHGGCANATPSKPVGVRGRRCRTLPRVLAAPCVSCCNLWGTIYTRCPGPPQSPPGHLICRQRATQLFRPPILQDSW
jgi:hypothetical protein